MKIPHTLLLSCVLSLEGCSTTVDYPQTWPPVAVLVGAGCESIFGTYSNTGEEAAAGQPTYLSDWLLDRNSKARAYRYLSITLNESKSIDLRGTDAAASETVLLSRIERYDCENGALTIYLSAVKSGDNAVSVGSSKRKLYRSPGHLVVESLENGVGIVLLIPVVASANNWARFPISKAEH